MGTHECDFHALRKDAKIMPMANRLPPGRGGFIANCKTRVTIIVRPEAAENQLAHNYPLYINMQLIPNGMFLVDLF
jgi:hypothetical protein